MNLLNAVILAAAEGNEAPNPILPEPNEIIWGALSFAVLFFLISKFAFPAVKKGIDARADKIRGSLDEARPIYLQGEYRSWNTPMAREKRASRRQIERYLLPALAGTLGFGLQIAALAWLNRAWRGACLVWRRDGLSVSRGPTMLSRNGERRSVSALPLPGRCSCPPRRPAG